MGISGRLRNLPLTKVSRGSALARRRFKELDRDGSPSEARADGGWKARDRGRKRKAGPGRIGKRKPKTHRQCRLDGVWLTKIY